MPKVDFNQFTPEGRAEFKRHGRDKGNDLFSCNVDLDLDQVETALGEYATKASAVMTRAINATAREARKALLQSAKRITGGPAKRFRTPVTQATARSMPANSSASLRVLGWLALTV